MVLPSMHTTLIQSRISVDATLTSHRRRYDVVLTSCLLDRMYEGLLSFLILGSFMHELAN